MKQPNTKSHAFFFRRISLLLAASAFSVLSACGGGGGSGSGSDGAANPAGAASNLFVADAGTASIGSVINTNFSTSTTAVDRLIQGSATRLSINITGIAIDKATDRLYVAQGTEILVFDNAGQAKGNIAPARILASSPNSKFAALSLDRVNDRLYVADQVEIKVFDHASTAVNATPARTLSLAGAVSLGGLALDLTRNILYANLNDSRGCGIAVLENAGAINGTVAPNRVINSCANAKIAIDTAKDRLYTLNGGTTVFIIDQASMLNGAPPVNGFILTGSTGIRDLAFDAPNDRLYAVDFFHVYQINRINAAGVPIGYVATIPAAQMLTAIAVR